MKKWQYDNTKVLYKNVESLVEFYGLPDNVKEGISQISKQGYIAGSNSIYEVFKCKSCGRLPCCCKQIKSN